MLHWQEFWLQINNLIDNLIPELRGVTITERWLLFPHLGNGIFPANENWYLTIDRKEAIILSY